MRHPISALARRAVATTTALALAVGPALAAPQATGARGAPQGRGQAQAQPMPVPRAPVLRVGDTKLQVDGDLSEWPAVPALRMDDPRQLSGTAVGAWRGTRDLAANVFLLWDDQHLHVGALVLDDWHRPLDQVGREIAQIPPADSLVLTFDPKRDTRAIGPDPGRREDREFWLGEVEGEDSKVALWDRYRGTARIVDSSIGVVRHDAERGVTVYEARLPWREILPPGTTPAAGLACDLQIVVNDLDDVTDLMPQTRAGWTFGTGPRIDPGLLGTILLIDRAADAAGVELPRPDVPAPPSIPEDPVPPPAHWIAMSEKLADMPPVLVTRELEAPAAHAGGLDRLAVLEDIERQAARFPRADFIEFSYRVHRRMTRETAGMVATGLPHFWQLRLAQIARAAVEAPPAGTVRVFRLPLGGWLVRSAQATFAIDPAEADIARVVGGALDFVLLTTPLDPTRRNDQLLLRMSAAKRRFFTHLAFHLPGMKYDEIPLAKIGETYSERGLKIVPIGAVSEEGNVAGSVAYRIEWPDGTTMLVSGLGVQPDLVSGNRGVDALLLSAMHPLARQIGQRLTPGVTLVGDAWRPSSLPGALGRVTLAEVHALQEGLRPQASVLLAPGESWDLRRGQ